MYNRATGGLTATEYLGMDGVDGLQRWDSEGCFVYAINLRDESCYLFLVLFYDRCKPEVLYTHGPFFSILVSWVL